MGFKRKAFQATEVVDLRKFLEGDQNDAWFSL